MAKTKRLTYCSSARATRMGGYKTFSEILKNMGVSRGSLHPFIAKTMFYKVTEEILKWIENNPEGFKMPLDMGYLAVTKTPIIPFMENKYEILDRVKNLTTDEVSDKFKKRILAKYGKSLNEIELKEFMKRGKMINKVLWFNKRNCSFDKALSWRLALYKRAKGRIKDSPNEFYRWNFQDFYDYKVKYIDE